MTNNTSIERFHTFVDYMDRDIRGIVIPQKVYLNTTGGFIPRQSIEFMVNGRLGIRLRDAYDSAFGGLSGASDRITLNTGMKVTYRVLWPGYGPWGKPVHVFTHGGDRDPITRSRVAYLVADAIHELRAAIVSVPSAEPDWHPARIPFDKLFLLEVRHASPGSWQPVLSWEP